MGSEPHRSPAGRPLVTLDYNPLIALRDNQPAAPAVRNLLDLGRAGLITLNIPMSAAMEAPHDPNRPEECDLITWLDSLGIPREHMLTSWRPVGFVTPSAHGRITYDVRWDIALMEHIHRIIHPGKPGAWPEFRDRKAEECHLTAL